MCERTSQIGEKPKKKNQRGTRPNLWLVRLKKDESTKLKLWKLLPELRNSRLEDIPFTTERVLPFKDQIFFNHRRIRSEQQNGKEAGIQKVCRKFHRRSRNEQV